MQGTGQFTGIKKTGQLTGIKKQTGTGKLTDTGYRADAGRMASAGRTAAIGHIGKKIVFETSDKRILGFKKMQRTVKGRWAVHPRVGKKPKKQFLGPDADQITFTITLNAEHGVKPRKTLEEIEKLVWTGRTQTVVIGSRRVGSGKFSITEISEIWETILNRGEVAKITFDITLEEYA